MTPWLAVVLCVAKFVLMSGGQRGASGFPFRSSSYGCLHLRVGLTGLDGSGADSIARTYRWPCSPIRDRVTQPAGEIRSRLVVQRYGSSGWSTCRDSGYVYNTSTAFGWVAGLDMGTGADCARLPAPPGPAVSAALLLS